MINGFTIEGILNIEHASLMLESMNALIAPNGYGKSNMLRAIEFGIRFMTADKQERKNMLGSRFTPNNISILRKDFLFGIKGSIYSNGSELLFDYSYKAAWAAETSDGRIIEEHLKVKAPADQRYRQQINRQSTNECLFVPSATGRCSRHLEVAPLQLALSLIADSSVMFLHDIASQIASVAVSNIETLDNPESYFSIENNKGVQMLDGMTLSHYLYNLKQNDNQNYSMLKDGIMQLMPNIVDFSSEVILLADGQSKIYDVRIKEKHNVNPTSINQLSGGSKRMIFLFTMCVAAQSRDIPMIMLEEPENSVHPKLMENLLLTLQNYASDTKILMTSHSPYLMRYLTPEQMFFGLPKSDGLAHFAKVNPSKQKYLYRYAGDMELTFGEFMFDFMLDMEGNKEEKLSAFFE